MASRIDERDIVRQIEGMVHTIIAPAMETIAEQAVEDGGKDFLNIANEKLHDLYKAAVDNFYLDYKPTFYKRAGDTASKTGGLYDLLIINNSDDGFDYDFDSSSIPDRSGDTDTLFVQVFQLGWHGGADRGAKHPQPGVPYWRKPPAKPGIKYPYRNWGRPADIANEAPYAAFIRLKEEYENGEALNDYISCIQSRWTAAWA